MWVLCLDQEDPLEEDMATHSSILAGESHGQGAWRAACVRCAHDCAQHMHTQRRKFTKGRNEEMEGGRERRMKEGLFPLPPLAQNPTRSQK